jgi:hypothetical protein
VTINHSSSLSAFPEVVLNFKFIMADVDDQLLTTRITSMWFYQRGQRMGYLLFLNEYRMITVFGGIGVVHVASFSRKFWLVSL